MQPRVITANLLSQKPLTVIVTSIVQVVFEAIPFDITKYAKTWRRVKSGGIPGYTG